MKKRLTVLLVLLLAVTAAACGANNGTKQGAGGEPAGSQSQGQGASQSSGSAGAADEMATKYPLKLKDSSGVELTLAKAPERIVSTSTAETEILFALGLGDKVVGVSDFDNYPDAVKDKPKMGGVSAPNVEAVLAANADLIVTSISIKADALEKFRSLNMPLFKFEPKSIEDIYANITTIGLMTDRQKEAKALVEKMRKEVESITAAVAALKPEQRKKVYIEFSPGYTVGKGEFMDEVLTLAGGLNIAADTKGYNKINEEKIIQDNPAVIFYTTGTKDKAGNTLDQLIKSRNGWDKIEAIQKGQLIGVDQDTLNRPGPRIVEGLRSIAKGTYPDLIK